MAKSKEKIVSARLRLRDRFLSKLAATPGMSDPKPLGSGPRNRHGMPKVPPNQTPTADGKWPVLDLGTQPHVTRETFRLRVDGACAKPYTIDFAGLLALEQIEDVSDFHCVTGWSKLDVPWTGVRVSTLLDRAEPNENATHLMCHASDGYETNLPLSEALKDDVLLVYMAEGRPLPVEHGGPVRMITPELYAWKGAKWISRLELLTADRKGFWELRGYSNSAHPWRNDRYS